MLPEGVSISIPEKGWDELFLPAIQDVQEVRLFLKDIAEKYLLERSEELFPGQRKSVQARIFPIQQHIDTNGAGTLGIKGITTMFRQFLTMLIYWKFLSTLLSIKGYIPEVGVDGGVYLFLHPVFLSGAIADPSIDL